MDLEFIFKNKADQNRLFIADIKIQGPDGTRRHFRHHLQSACYEAGVVCGVNETEAGFQLGFEHPDDYRAVMAIVEPRMVEDEKRSNAGCEAVLQSYGASDEEIAGFRAWASRSEGWIFDHDS